MPENEKARNTFEFPPELVSELQNHSALPTLNKDACVEYAQSRGIDVKRNAVHQAVTNRTLPSYLISGQALVSPRDLVGWLLSKRQAPKPSKTKSA